MAETIKGAGVFWGIGASFLCVGLTIDVNAKLRPQSVNQDVKADIDTTIKDYKGETVSRIFADQKRTLKIEVIPTADTIAHAKGASLLPTPGSLVTITDTDDTSASGTNSGKYLFISGSSARSNTDALKLTFDLEQYIAADITTTAA
jgi:hypothetical protein